MKIYPIILSGGAGTRLWPLSRTQHPKQFKALNGEETLFQQTASRLPVDATIEPPLVICNEDHRFLVAEQLREKKIPCGGILLEPVARSTAPAVTLAALSVPNPEQAVLVVMPADHAIEDQNGFLRSIRTAAELAMQGWLMTLGISPTKPHTGFGYIERGDAIPGDKGAFAVARFKEKPDEKTAVSYLETGRYDWNSGIFILRADRYLQEIETYQPEILKACRKAVEGVQKDLDFLRIGEEAFAASPSISVDYAVMEKAEKIGVLPVSYAWSDVGGWAALWEIGPKDENENVLNGDVILKNVSHSYLRAEKRLIAGIGLENMAVIETADAIFVSPLDQVDEVKDIATALKKTEREESRIHEKVWRPWGSYERLDAGSCFQVKRLVVNPGAKLSLQLHHHRAEHWVVVSGTARITCGDQVLDLKANQSHYIPLEAKHRLENPTTEPVILIEVQSGDYLGEDDIERFEDIYKR